MTKKNRFIWSENRKIYTIDGVDLSVFTSDKPVFFGHYWLNGIPKIVNEHAICLDYSVAKGGKLVAARITDGKISLIY